MAKVWCSAPGCSNNLKRTPNNSFYRFPRDNERSEKWVTATGRDDLRNKSVDYRYKNCRICSDHFEKSKILCTKRLVWNAVPTIIDFSNSTPKRKGRRKKSTETGMTGTTTSAIMPATGSPEKKQEQDESSTLLHLLDGNPAQGHLSDEKPDPPQLSDEILTALQDPEDHSYARATETDGEASVAAPVVELQSSFTQTDPEPTEPPPARAEVATMCSLAKSTDRVKIFRLKKKVKLLKANEVKPRDPSVSVQDIVNESAKYLDDTTLHFFASQLQIGKRRTKGRRYTSSDKLKAYALLRQSPAAYRFYRKLKLFALPSDRCLRRWLKKPPAQEGLSDAGFEDLKRTARTMSEQLQAAVEVYNQDQTKGRTSKKAAAAAAAAADKEKRAEEEASVTTFLSLIDFQ